MNRQSPRRTAASEPKPFIWLPLSGKPAPRTEPTISHDRFRELTGSIRLSVEVMSSFLHVGSGAILLREVGQYQPAYYAFARSQGQLIIPGTSLKGAIRTLVEAITNSCVSQVAAKERDRVPPAHASKRCDVKTDAGSTPPLCPACRLFGHTGYRGRVYFTDAAAQGEPATAIIKIPDLWAPRRGRDRKIYIDGTFHPMDDRPEKNHRFVEAVPQSARFVTTLFFENTRPAELGVLLHAIGLRVHPEDPSKMEFAFPAKIGGAKPRCLGAVRLTPKSIRLVDTEDANLFESLSGEGTRQPVRDTLLSWLRDDSLLDHSAIHRLWTKFDEEARDCPKGMY
jgi:CRISPR/Cas system CSM-associated protein Csm3 (group 7 of RAMP superfamily)